MADLKDLQEMIKSGEFSKELLEDEKFKTEIKKILKEKNGIEITDQDIPEVVKNLEKSLISEPDYAQVEQMLSKENLENISGGVSKAKIIKGVSALAGAALGTRLGYKEGEIVSKVHLQDSESKAKSEYMHKATIYGHKDLWRWTKGQYEYVENDADVKKAKQTREKAPMLSAGAGGIAGLGAGYLISDYICMKFGIK